MLDVNARWVEYIFALALRLPLLLVVLYGVVSALVRWRKAPLSAGLTFTACLLLLLASCAFPAMFVWLTPFVRENAPPGEEMRRTIWTNQSIIGASSLCTAVSVGALIAAVFAGRRVATPRRAESMAEPQSDDGVDRPKDERIRPA